MTQEDMDTAGSSRSRQCGKNFWSHVQLPEHSLCSRVLKEREDASASDRYIKGNTTDICRDVERKISGAKGTGLQKLTPGGSSESARQILR